MDKKSGVYYYLTDNSIRAGGASTFGGLVLMCTARVPGTLTSVSASDYKNKLGYDVDGNNSYAGLDMMLATVAKLEVLPMNVGAKVGYCTWDQNGVRNSGVSMQYDSVDEIIEGISSSSGVGDGYLWVAHKDPGYWGDRYVGFKVEDASNKEYSLWYYSKSNGKYTLLSTYYFSMDSKASDYFINVDFGDLSMGWKGGSVKEAALTAIKINSGVSFVDANLYPLGLGSFGSYDLNLSDSDLRGRLAAIDKSAANVVVLNGLTESVASIQTIVSYCANQDRTVLIDAPIITTDDKTVLSANGVIDWVSNNNLLMEGGQYAEIASVPDQTTSSSGKKILISPTANLFKIYANMYAAYGHVNYPPAGITYGSITASHLMDSDFYLYGDELKTGRVNYFTRTSSGVCLWEQRTLYPLGNSDLSYANTPFILRDLKSRLIDFMSQFTFRYSTPIDLLTIRSGLSSILDSFVQNMFLVNYTLYVPTYQEAQASGHELNISIGVSVINDAEVINLMVGLQNAADLAAA